MVGPRRGRRVPTLLHTARSIRIRPPSSFTSRLGPCGKEEKDEWEPRLCQGGRGGATHKNHRKKYYIY